MLSLAPRSLRPILSALFVSATFALIAAFSLAASLNAETVSNAAPAHGPANRLTQPIQENSRVALQGTLHPLANKANDRGAVSDGMKLSRIQVVLKRSDAQESALKQLIGEMHAPGSANYHKWLTPETFGKQFGPSDADVAKVEAWLSSHGFSITKLNPGRQTIEFSGTAGQFRDTFHAQIHSYQVNGETHFANASAPEIPAAIAPVFGGFTSLNNFRLKSYAHVLGKAQFNAETHEVKPSWTIGSPTNYSLALAPGDFNIQYDLNPLYAAGTTGKGQSIAIVNESNINIAQVNNYRKLFGLSVNPPQVIIDGNDPGIDGINSPYGPNGASGEAYLDVELAGAVAPDALVNLVIANDTELQSGLTLAIERAVYSNISPIISISFGECEANQGAFNAIINNYWEQAAAQGITVLVSSGDQGSAGCDNDNTQYYAVGGQAVNGLASTPWNVAVGGTDFYYSGGSSQLPTYWNTVPSNGTPTVSLKSKVPEQPWNDSQYGLNLVDLYAENGTTSIAAGSGGASTAGIGSGTTATPYPKPSWQTGTGVPNDNARDLPDLSLFAANGFNNSFYPVCLSDGDCEGGSVVQISGVGGTSVSTPAFAGMMALVNQKYGRQGQANYVLYPLAKQFPTAFNDVTAGTNSVPCAFSSTNVTPKNCQSVTNPITVNDPTYGTAVEGEIGFTAGVPAYNATAGYDLASGLGTVDGNIMVTNWANVKLGSTTTTLTPSPTTFTHGTAATISGTVTGASPTGNVALITTSPETSQQGTTNFALVNGAYSGSVSYLPGGTYDISGYYAGDGSNAASTSTPVTITVTPEASTTTLKVYSSLTSNTGTPLPASGGSLVYGAPATLSATETGQTSGTTSTNPTGSVAFVNGATVLNTAVINTEGDAEYNAALAPGSYSVKANYSGDSSYTASSSAATSFTVTKQTPIISAIDYDTDQNGEGIVSANGSFFTAFVENTAVYSGIGVSAPSGTLTLSGAPAGTTASAVLTPGINPSTGNIAGSAVFKVPAGAKVGNYTFSFAYAGDINYAAATQPIAETLNSYTGGLASTTTAAASAAATSPAAVVSVSVTVTGQSSGGAPTGTVYLLFGGNSQTDYYVAAGSLVASGATTSTATLQVNSASLDKGTNQLTAQYFGDNTYYPSASTVTIVNSLSDFSLQPLTTTITVSNTGTTPGVQTDTINLTSFNGFTGAVALTCTAPTGVACSLSAASANLTANGSASIVATVNTSGVTTAGKYNIVITGTDSTGHYVHTVGLQVVTPLITSTATPSFSLAGTPVAISAPGGAGVSTITATPAGGFTGSIALTCTVTGPTGATDIPTCSAASAVVTGATPATASLTFNTLATTTAGAYTATVTGTSGTVTSATTIAVTVAGTVATPGTFTLSNSGNITVTAPASGTSTISVVPGTTNAYTGAVALTCAITSSPAAATGVPTCALAPATVTLAGATQPSTLTVGTIATTTPGTYMATVTGSGTGGSAPATTVVTITVAGAVTPTGTFALTNSGAITVASQGATSTSTISVVPDATAPYAGVVGLTCAVTASPAGATEIPTCTVAPASVTLAGATMTSTLTINTTAQTTARLNMPLKGIFTAGGGVALATLLFFGVPFGRRRKRALRTLGTLRILSMALFFAMIAGAVIGCGSGSSNGGGTTGGTTTGAYTVTVTGTPASGTAQTVMVPVTVN